MQKIILLSLLLLSFVCCDKDDNEKVDDILYTDIVPDTSLVSIDSIKHISNGPYCITSKIPYPSDKNMDYEIDINSDNVNDFRISVGHTRITCNDPKCGDYQFFSCMLEIKGINSGDSLIPSSSQRRIFKKDEEIELKENNGDSDWNILISGGCHNYPPGEDLQDSYIGVKKNNCVGWIHLNEINNGIIIMDFAVNLTPKKSIIAGEKE
ncbi:MAG: hypothetical protein ACQESM_00585 [Bacteroidota bacterium]